jgi:hypothetical protein
MKAVKRPQHSGVGDVPSRRVNLYLASQSHQRLMLHALMRHQSPGEVVAALIDEHLRDWRVQANPSARSASPESASSTAELNLEEAIAPAAA